MTEQQESVGLEDKTKETLRRMEEFLDKQDEEKGEDSLGIEHMDLEAALIGAELGHSTGRQMAEWYDRNALNFTDSVFRVVMTMARAQNGIRNLAAMIGKKSYNWTVIAIIIALTIFSIVIFSNPTNSTNFGAWVSGNGGLNGIALIALAGVISVILYMKWRA